jgi:hypothetical protein
LWAVVEGRAATNNKKVPIPEEPLTSQSGHPTTRHTRQTLEASRDRDRVNDSNSSLSHSCHSTTRRSPTRSSRPSSSLSPVRPKKSGDSLGQSWHPHTNTTTNTNALWKERKLQRRAQASEKEATFSRPSHESRLQQAKTCFQVTQQVSVEKRHYRRGDGVDIKP